MRLHSATISGTSDLLDFTEHIRGPRRIFAEENIRVVNDRQLLDAFFRALHALAIPFTGFLFVMAGLRVQRIHRSLEKFRQSSKPSSMAYSPKGWNSLSF